MRCELAARRWHFACALKDSGYAGQITNFVALGENSNLLSKVLSGRVECPGPTRASRAPACAHAPPPQQLKRGAAYVYRAHRFRARARRHVP